MRTNQTTPITTPAQQAELFNTATEPGVSEDLLEAAIYRTTTDKAPVHVWPDGSLWVGPDLYRDKPKTYTSVEAYLDALSTDNEVMAEMLSEGIIVTGEVDSNYGDDPVDLPLILTNLTCDGKPLLLGSSDRQYDDRRDRGPIAYPCAMAYRKI